MKREVSLRRHHQDLGVSRVRGCRVRREAALLALGTREMAVTSLEKGPQREEWVGLGQGGCQTSGVWRPESWAGGGCDSPGVHVGAAERTDRGHPQRSMGERTLVSRPPCGDMVQESLLSLSSSGAKFSGVASRGHLCV